MKKDLTLNLFAKVLGFVFGILLIDGLIRTDTFIAKLNFIISIYFLMRTIDFSQSYLRRLANASAIELDLVGRLVLYLLQIIVIIIFCFCYHLSYIETLLLSMCSISYCELTIKANRAQLSYLYSIVHPLSGLILIFIANALSINEPTLLYLSLTLTLQVLFLLTLNKRQGANREYKSLINLYERQHVFQFAAVVLYMCHAELSQILMYGMGDLSDYTFLSAVKRIELLILGFSSILVNILWNRYTNTISRYDRILINEKIYIVLLAILIIIYCTNSLQLDYIFLVVGIGAIVNLWFYFASQIMLRLGSAYLLFKLSLLEACTTLFVLLITADLFWYFSSILSIAMFKVIWLRRDLNAFLY